MKIKRIAQSGIVSTVLLGSSLSAVLPTAKAATNDLGNIIWEDTNKNGKLDAGESGVPGIKLELHTIYGDLIQSVNTDTEGHYRFSNIPNGAYYIKMNVPSPYTFYGSKHFGADGITGYLTTADELNTNINAGLQKNTVDILPTNVTVTPEQASIKVGESYQIKANLQPTNVTQNQLKYISSDPDIATVDDSGKVTARAKGKAVITVETRNGIKKTSTVTVKEAQDLPPLPQLNEIGSNPMGYVSNGITRNRVLSGKSVNFTFKDITGKTYPQYGVNLGTNYETNSGIAFSKFGEKGFQPTYGETGAFAIEMDKLTSNIRLLIGAVYSGEFVKIEAYKNGVRVPVKLDLTQQLGNVNSKFFSNGTDTILTTSQTFTETEGYGVNIGGNYYDKLIIYPNLMYGYLPIWIDDSNANCSS
ncbi:SdrD B-like domain-containing protein [Bacillus toyonensis]|uniref:Uncharacterized protein n=1 Tax=Bacillus toyonensis TaxID=155322 RepID=A0A2C4PNY5_9BACI|nr:SdrD B-like domain-containing protein [Bacillus toyonensis]PGA96087.1 hypothetical protein COL93_24175 [Bacillus toyonensis]PHD66745.1 hypothetical protein COF40_20770 [Bacillus toyonensis]